MFEEHGKIQANIVILDKTLVFSVIFRLKTGKNQVNYSTLTHDHTSKCFTNDQDRI